MLLVQFFYIDPPLLIKLRIRLPLLRHLDLLVHVLLWLIDCVVGMAPVRLRQVFPEVFHSAIVVKKVVEIITFRRTV